MTTTTWLRLCVLLAVAGAIADPGCADRQRASVELALASSVPAADVDRVAQAVRAAGMVIRSDDGPATLRVGVGLPRDILAMHRTARLAVAVRTSPHPHITAVAAPSAAVAGVVLPLRVRVDGLTPGDSQQAVQVRDVRTTRLIGSAPAATPAADGGRADAQAEPPWIEVPLYPREAGVWPLCVTVGSDDAPYDATRCERLDLTVAPATVLVDLLEARPSWAARFVRLALARWDGLRVSSVVRMARAVDIRTGPATGVDVPGAGTIGPPADVTIVAGLDALTAADVDRLARRVADDGHSVVLLADGDIPDGRLGRLWPHPLGGMRVRGTPARIPLGAHRWEAAEWLAPGPPSTDVEPLAYLQASPAVPVVWGRAMGEGRVVLVTALDTWRWRAADEASHDAAWQALVLSVAATGHLHAGRAWRISGAAHDEVQLVVPARDDTAIPPRIGPAALRATMVRADGEWRGVMSVAPSDASVVVTLPASAGADAAELSWPVISALTVPAAWMDVHREVGATGGRVVAVESLAATLSELAANRDVTGPRWYLTRQWWFAAAIVAALGLEWWMRRRAFAR